jgi:asparagine synthase (glutamine-hydrolysing)
MGGFALGYGSPDDKAVLQMLEKIRHRGPHARGMFRSGQVCMAQNYMRADLGPETMDSPIPVTAPTPTGLRICYDGQIGNLDGLATGNGVGAGPNREERLLLKLYETQGSGFLSLVSDAIFALIISNGNDFFAARDLLGIKTLFYGRSNGTLYLATELKSMLTVTDDVHEFPAGHFMDADGKFTQFASLPDEPLVYSHQSVEQMTRDIRDIIERSLASRVDFSRPTGSLLSGGIDSSVIATLGTKAYREAFGDNARLRTFALGTGECTDLANARLVAENLNSDHCEVVVGIDDLVEVLPEVIYYLESFDPSLVRSSASNYLISKRASQEGIEVLLSGEGGDEIFCGYTYLKDCPPEDLHHKQMECMGFLHNNASLRLDRMNQCNSVKVVAPLISGELLNYSIALPPEFKVRTDGNQKIEKWIFRKTFENVIPELVAWRPKQEFSQGSGSADVLPAYFEERVSDRDLTQAQQKYPIIRSKEELYYFNLFAEHFGDGKAIETVGQWISL